MTTEFLKSAKFPSIKFGQGTGFEPWGSLTKLTEKKFLAAVAMIFIQPNREYDHWRLILTKRSTQVKTHKGQISLPGGMIETSDKCPADTAIREVSEEIGISSNSLEIKGILPTVVSLDKSLVVPLVMIAEIDGQRLEINPSEVEQLYTLPWSCFSTEHIKNFSFCLFGIRRNSIFFTNYSDVPVWGLTASIFASAQMQ